MEKNIYELTSKLNFVEKKTPEQRIQEITLNNNIETSSMYKFREKILLLIDVKDIDLVDFLLNKVWFNVTYDSDIESRLKKYETLSP